MRDYFPCKPHTNSAEGRWSRYNLPKNQDSRPLRLYKKDFNFEKPPCEKLFSASVGRQGMVGTAMYAKLSFLHMHYVLLLVAGFSRNLWEYHAEASDLSLTQVPNF